MAPAALCLLVTVQVSRLPLARVTAMYAVACVNEPLLTLASERLTHWEVWQFLLMSISEIFFT